ncbi:MAG TPA: MoxR family ATPase, partial [Umezawaea sp.]|nr:MoxR family ATPase [Umezawaea sp.]
MRSSIAVTPARLPEVLLHVAVVRPVFLWGAPGIGKSSLVRDFAESLGLECVTLLGTQLAPEDLIGVPELVNGRSRFAPPESIARDEPYCLFLDELNASSPEVQKAFYSLILDRRIGAYELPEGSIVIGAGNRASDNA